MLKSMKKHGAGLKHLESQTLKFGMEMLTEMSKCCGQAFDPFDVIRLALGSIMMTLVYGYSTPTDVKQFAELENHFVRMMKPSGFYLLLDICPLLRFVLPKLKMIHQEFLDVGKNVEQTFRSYTNNRKKTLNSDNSRVIIDHFLLHDNLGDPKGRNIAFDDTDLTYIGFDLLIGGIATSSTFLYNLLGILVNHPSIQDKAYAEIIQAIGKQPPTLEDRQKLPIIEALILENLRYTSLVAVALPHCTSSSSQLHGYLIPEGTLIFPNLWAQHHNEKYWDDPWEFNPLRFLEDGQLVPPDHIKRQRLIAFGAGRRQCTGEAFARHWLFLLVTLMLQNFKFLPAEGHPAPQHDPRKYVMRLNLLIKPYHLSAQSREQ